LRCEKEFVGATFDILENAFNLVALVVEGVPEGLMAKVLKLFMSKS